jgi:hypothetical protein
MRGDDYEWNSLLVLGNSRVHRSVQSRDMEKLDNGVRIPHAGVRQYVAKSTWLRRASRTK